MINDDQGKNQSIKDQVSGKEANYRGSEDKMVSDDRIRSLKNIVATLERQMGKGEVRRLT